VKCELKFARNGWILEYEVNGELQQYVMEEGADEVDAFKNFLQIVDEQLGPTSSRYSEKRIYINAFPGDKCEVPWSAELREEVEWLYKRSLPEEGES